MKHRGRAIVFDTIEDYKARINDPALDADASCVLVLRNSGPVGYPGMAEVGNMGLPPAVLKPGVTDMVRISDARMSGTAYGTVVLHVCPEAAVGGPLALVREGDFIELDVEARRLHLDVPDEELARRRAEWRPPKPAHDGGYVQIRVRHVEQAHRGADLDFLEGCRGHAVPRSRISRKFRASNCPSCRWESGCSGFGNWKLGTELETESRGRTGEPIRSERPPRRRHGRGTGIRPRDHRAVARVRRQRGVVGSGRSRDRETAGELKGRGTSSRRPSTSPSMAQVEAATAATVRAFGGIDILVANAGIAGPNHKTWEYPPDEWQRVIEIDLMSVFYCCRAVIPEMLRANTAASSRSRRSRARKATPNASAYSAAKAGVIALTKSLGKELAGENIAVNCITPAAAKTRIFEQMSQAHLDWMLSKIPRGRFLQIDELASLAAWLVSEENSFSTGAVFDISGGRSTY